MPSFESQWSIPLSHFHISLQSHKIRSQYQTEGRGANLDRCYEKNRFNKNEREERGVVSERGRKRESKREGLTGRRYLFSIVNEWQRRWQIYGRSGVPVQH